MSILTAGLSPAWQQIVLLDRLHTGEVNRAREVHWCASGKALNVAQALYWLGGSGDRSFATSSVCLVGGSIGEAICRQFARDGIPARWVKSATPTRVCTTILDRETGTTTEIVQNAGPIAADELDEFRRAVVEEAAGAEVVVLAGSLPEGAPVSLYRELMAATKGRTVLDCQGDLLLASLEARPFVVKPNREELGRTLGRNVDTDADLHAAMRELNERGAEWVVVTQGARAVWIRSQAQLVSIEPPRVPVVNPIGSGDCLAAGIAFGLASGYHVPEAVVYGIAAAADNVGRLLPARLDWTAVEDLRQRLSPPRIVH